MLACGYIYSLQKEFCLISGISLRKKLGIIFGIIFGMGEERRYARKNNRQPVKYCTQYCTVLCYIRLYRIDDCSIRIVIDCMIVANVLVVSCNLIFCTLTIYRGLKEK